jgi:hypothetical protein
MNYRWIDAKWEINIKSCLEVIGFLRQTQIQMFSLGIILQLGGIIGDKATVIILILLETNIMGYSTSTQC